MYTPTISYHLLHKHPHVLEKVRQELDDVFGAGVGAAEKLKCNPYLINKCEYTLAVIKEVLRLWTPASTIRLGQKDYFVKDPITGEMLPTAGLVCTNLFFRRPTDLVSLKIDLTTLLTVII